VGRPGARVIPHDIPAIVDSAGKGRARTRDLNRRKLPPAQEITMKEAANRVVPDNVAASVDTQGAGETRARKIEQRKLTAAQ